MSEHSDAAQPEGDEPPKKRMDVAQSVVFSMRTLETVAGLQPVTLADVARAMEAPKTTVLRSLRALAVAGYVFQEPNPSRWSLTLRCLRLAEAANSALGLIDAAMPVMQDLAHTTEETISLGVLEGDAMVVVANVDGRRALRAFSERGALLPVHASSSGKAVLAHLDESEVDAFLAGRRLKSFTERTITTAAALRQELEAIRKRGYAVNLGEREPDVVGVAAPIRNANGKPIAALAVALPRQQSDESSFDTIGEQCIRAADTVSYRLGWNGR